MGLEFLHVEKHEAVMGENQLRGEEGEIGEVLVIDGVELVEFDEFQEMGKLHRQHPLGLQCKLQAGDEVVDVGDVGENVVADQEVGLGAIGCQDLGGFGAEEPDQGRDALLLGDFGDVRRRLDAEDRYALGLEVLQQIAVVAGDLDDLAMGAEAEPRDHLVGIALGVAEPAVGVG